MSEKKFVVQLPSQTFYFTKAYSKCVSVYLQERRDLQSFFRLIVIHDLLYGPVLKTVHKVACMLGKIGSHSPFDSDDWIWSKYFLGLCCPECSKVPKNYLGLNNWAALLTCHPWDSGQRSHKMLTFTCLDSLWLNLHAYAWTVSPSKQHLGG